MIFFYCSWNARQVSDAGSVSTAAPAESATTPLPGLVGNLCRQADDLNDELDHLIRALLLYNKRTSLSGASDDYPDEAAALASALATVRQQHQADLGKIQEARLRDRAKSDVQIAKLQSQVQHLQAETKELQESLTEKESSYRRLQVLRSFCAEIVLGLRTVFGRLASLSAGSVTPAAIRMYVAWNRVRVRDATTGSQTVQQCG